MRRGHYAGVAVVAMLCVLAGPTTAQAQSWMANNRFIGQAADGTRSFIKFNWSDRISDYSISVKAACSDGRKRELGVIARGEPPVKQGKEPGGRGIFSHDTGVDRYRLRGRGGRPVSGKGRTVLKGGVGSGSQYDIAITSYFTSKKLKCRGSNSLTLYLHGSSQAPYRNPSMASGRYYGQGRLIKVGLYMIAPMRQITRFRVITSVSCNNGVRYRLNAPYFTFFLQRQGETATRLDETLPLRVAGVGRGRERTVFTIRFYKGKDAYRAKGRLRVISIIRSRGKRVRCSASRPFLLRLRYYTS